MYCFSQWPAKSSWFSHASAATTLTMPIKVAAMVTVVTVYTGHRRTLFFLSRIVSLFMCIPVGVIWINSLVGGCTWAEVWTLATERVMLYSTWCRCTSALTMGYVGRSFYSVMIFKIFNCNWFHRQTLYLGTCSSKIDIDCKVDPTVLTFKVQMTLKAMYALAFGIV